MDLLQKEERTSKGKNDVPIILLGDACGQGMQATGFARVMLDKALGFLLKQCHTYVLVYLAYDSKL